MTTYIEQPSDAQFRAFLRSLDAGRVQLDRAAHLTDLEVRMVGAVTDAAA